MNEIIRSLFVGDIEATLGSIRYAMEYKKGCTPVIVAWFDNGFEKALTLRHTYPSALSELYAFIREFRQKNSN